MLVSVFIPTYNSAEFIAETLDSILLQTHKNIEVLCVDDESSDSTISIIKVYEGKDSRVKLFRKKNEGSVPFSWNYVFPHLSGDFTIYMSHDDILSPVCIEKLVEKLKENSEIDCIIPSLIFFEKDMNNPEGKYLTQNKKNDLSNHPTISGMQAFDEMLDYSIPGFALWRTSLIREIGMPTESFNSDEGMQRIWAKNCRKVAFSEAKFGYRQSTESIAKGIKPYHYFSIETNLRLYKEMKDMTSIATERKKHIQYKFFETLFYLESCYVKGLNKFSVEQQNKLNVYFADSYSELRKNLQCKRSIKGIVMKCCSICRIFYKLSIKYL